MRASRFARFLILKENHTPGNSIPQAGKTINRQTRRKARDCKIFLARRPRMMYNIFACFIGPFRLSAQKRDGAGFCSYIRV
jgi:hypothetical protein